jgi:hypothetical protein
MIIHSTPKNLLKTRAHIKQVIASKPQMMSLKTVTAILVNAAGARGMFNQGSVQFYLSLAEAVQKSKKKQSQVGPSQKNSKEVHDFISYTKKEVHKDSFNEEQIIKKTRGKLTKDVNDMMNSESFFLSKGLLRAKLAELELQRRENSVVAKEVDVIDSSTKKERYNDGLGAGQIIQHSKGKLTKDDETQGTTQKSISMN